MTLGISVRPAVVVFIECGRKAGCPLIRRQRSFVGHNWQARSSGRDPRDRRTTTDAAHRESAASLGPERDPMPWPAPPGQARASQSARAADALPRRATPRARGRAAASTARIRAADSTPRCRPRAHPADGGPRPTDARAQPTCRGRSTVAAALVQSGQHSLQRSDRLRCRRRPRGGQHRRRHDAGADCLGQ